MRAHVGQFERLAREMGIATTVYPSRRVTFRGESPQSVGDVMAPNDAAALYREAHRSLMLVVAAGPIRVARNPSAPVPTRRHTMALRQFVSHKASYAALKLDQDLGDALQTFSEWPARPGCAGENDPRVLPLHVFETQEDWTGLPEASLEAKFARLYGPASLRRDEGRKLWKRTSEYHGGPSLVIGGTPLRAGMHWDVSAERRGTLVTSNAVWRLRGAHGYVNVFPDATVDKSPGRSTATQVWPRRP
jgi:hypothetical protein